MARELIQPPELRRVHFEDGTILSRVGALVREHGIPYQWKALSDQLPDAPPSFCARNFRVAAGLETGEFGGMVFQDSDIAKWLEAVGYRLQTHPDAALEALADEVIGWIERAQQPDGYLNTYYTLKEPGNRFTNLRDCHELYCAGHMMEAAVAYYEATGKRALLEVMLRMARCIERTFGDAPGKLRGYPGHEEIELALVKMYRATGEDWLLALSKYFIDERGQSPNYFEQELIKREGKEHFQLSRMGLHYFQSHKPVREQREVVGHSVRALYLCAGMADVAMETDDGQLLEACRALFDNCVKRRMYITGGVGSTHHGEAFSFDYDLPNDTVYAETCASIALLLFCQRMLMIEPRGEYADAMERALYNTCLAGMSLDGERFFYVNPLQVDPQASALDPGKRHVLPTRPRWFGCACCPPNEARLFTSLGRYVCGVRGEDIYLHLYCAGEMNLSVNGQEVRLRVDTQYPWQGRVRIEMSEGAYALHVRVPGWCKAHDIRLHARSAARVSEARDGYVELRNDWAQGDIVELSFEMPPVRVYASPLVGEDVGKVAVMRGPLVYCAEQIDNGAGLARAYLPREAELREDYRSDLLGGVMTIECEGERAAEACEALYSTKPPLHEKMPLLLVPYYAWANRAEGEMVVWLHE